MNRTQMARLLSTVVALATVLSLTGVAVAYAPPVVATSQPAAASSVAAATEPDQASTELFPQGVEGKLLISFRRGTGTVSFMRLADGGDLMPGSKSAFPADKAVQFFAANRELFGLQDPAAELVATKTFTDRYGYTHLSYAQVYRGVPVFGTFLRAHFDAAGKLIAVNGATVPDIKIDVTPRLNATQASAIAIKAVIGQMGGDARRASFDVSARSSTLYIYRTGFVQDVPGRDHLVYEVEVAGQGVREFLYVDAHSGAIVDQISGIQDALSRELHEPSYPNLKWTEGDPFPTGNAAWDDEITGAGETYELFSNISGGAYLSFDGADATMITVNLLGDPDCPNAWWDGSTTNYCPDVTGDDTVAHEWTHAYTEYTHELIYAWQPGALNEAYSDIFGEIVDMVNGRGTDTPDGPRSDGNCSIYGSGTPSVDDTYRWLSGEDDPAFGGAIRDLWTPTCYGDPGKVSDSEYWCSADDNGGVHTNSGVPNHAFALLVDGGTYNGQTVTGIGLTKAAHIYWRAMSVYQGPSTGFPGHADALAQSCQDLLGIDLSDLSNGAPSGEVITAADCEQVDAVRQAVEFDESPSQCGFDPLLDPDAPPLCDNPDAVQQFFAEDWEEGVLPLDWTSGNTPAGWTVGTRDVANPATFDTPDWAVVSDLPGGGSPVPGSVHAAFVEDNPNYGDCQADTEAGVLWLQSPPIPIPPDVTVPRVAFDHWVATEAGWDGGNVKIQVNDGPWTLIPDSAFEFNDYPAVLNDYPSDNPMAGEPAFTGTNGGTANGSWGQSQINLAGLAAAGDTISLRFEMGLDGCNGVIGWYVDDVQAYYCSDEPEPVCGDAILNAGETCDDGNSEDGDGCSSTCQVEPGWVCTDPVPGGSTVRDGGFEEGTPNPFWDESSTNFGTPLCNTSSCNTSAGQGPHTGDWWAWFGGIDQPEIGSVSQEVVIPPGTETLSFFTQAHVCDSASDYLKLMIDGNIEFSIHGDDPACGAQTYTQQEIDVSGYADGGTHLIEFYSEIYASNGGVSNFFVDDVTLEVPGNDPIPSICTPIPGELACNGEEIDFELGIPASWYTANSGHVYWTTTADPDGCGQPNQTNGSGEAACADADETNGAADPYDAQMWSNPFDLSGATAALLTFEAAYNDISLDNDGFDVDVSVDDGTTWTNELSWDEDHWDPGEAVTLDLADYLGNPDVKVRFRYFGEGWDWWAQVDDVALTCEFGGEVPQIVVEPSSLSSTQPPDTITVETLTIGNVGTADLLWEIDEGVSSCQTPEDIPWISVTPVAGSTPPGHDTGVDVTFDSTGYAPGTYNAKLCIHSNDPANPLKHVPLEMTVEQAGDVPNLSIPSGVPAHYNQPVSVPVDYTSNGAAIASAVFSVDFDESCLAFDPTDSDSDGVPDAVVFNLPADFNGSVTYDPADTDGELDFFVADVFPPLASLPDGTLATIEFLPTCQPLGLDVEAPVGFSADPSASFGDIAGNSVPGTTSDGSVIIVFVGPELTMVENVPAYPLQTATMPVSFTANGHDIASVVFSVDFDESCLAFDPTDSDGDGIPDAVTPTLPADFDLAVSYDPGDTDGEIDILIADTFSPLAALPDGGLLSIEFLATCVPPTPDPIVAAVAFSDDPSASFGDTAGNSMPGTTHDGSVEIQAGTPGDCNSDGVVDAGDISACVLEIFDGDGNLPGDAPGGTFPGNPVGCDSNQDGTIDAGDISCTVLTIFNGPGTCGVPNQAAAAAGIPTLSLLDGLATSTRLVTPLSFDAGGHAISSLAFALTYDPRQVAFESVDFKLPAGFDGSAVVDEEAHTLNIAIADTFAPLQALPDEILASINWKVIGFAETMREPVQFSDTVPASFGDTAGRSIAGVVR